LLAENRRSLSTADFDARFARSGTLAHTLAPSTPTTGIHTLSGISAATLATLATSPADCIKVRHHFANSGRFADGLLSFCSVVVYRLAFWLCGYSFPVVSLSLSYLSSRARVRGYVPSLALPPLGFAPRATDKDATDASGEPDDPLCDTDDMDGTFTPLTIGDNTGSLGCTRLLHIALDDAIV
jgi:hypothetical protein